ncbi:MAG: fasciclin domain-containing protein [Candidatus Promineifilaceae bacterium]
MLAKSKVFILFALFTMIFTINSSSTVKAQSNTVVDVIRRDGRLGQFYSAIRAAGLEGMLSGPGPYTIFAPVNGSYGAAGDANTARQSVLYHAVNSHVTFGTLKASTKLTTVLGPDIYLTNNRGVTLNDSAKLVAIDLPAGNGTIHLINARLEPQEPVPAAPAAAPANNNSANGGQQQAPETVVAPDNVNSLVAPDYYSVQIHNPHANPAYVSGSTMAYSTGIHTDSSSCKGLTWTLLSQSNGVTNIGSDRKSNPYRGDTGCGTPLPILCINQTYAPSISARTRDGWAFGEVKITTPIQGLQLSSRQQADSFCQQAYGANWRMAEFHDAELGRGTGHVSGHDLWALGAVNTGQRFWVAISDQPANPWNSVVTKVGPPNLPHGANVFLRGGDPAYVGTQPLRMSMAEGVSAGRAGCKGTTMVLHQQINGKVQMGMDRSSNPFVGDRSCGQRLPILCIRTDGYGPPANSHGRNYSDGWSSGWVKASNPVSGNQISEVGQASQICQQTFGVAWRQAVFHQSIIGQSGWEFWAYGSMPLGLRYWVGVNDQPANPWNTNN